MTLIERLNSQLPTGDVNGIGYFQRKDVREAIAALQAISDIRDSIIGLQTVNWSSHIYPLVVVLKSVGLDGLSYDDARAKYRVGGIA